MGQKGTGLVFFLLISFVFSSTPSFAQVNTIVTPTFLGNPFKTQWPDNGDANYARNVWDMQIFDGKVYFGTGNAANSAPAPNAGPAPIWSYSPSSGTFTSEFTTTDEEIETYRVINGQLYVPGRDPRGADNPGNFYRLAPGGSWNLIKTIPNGMHTFDFHAFDNRLFATLGAGNAQLSVLSSTDNGATWTPSTCPLFCNGTRMYTMFELNGKLYISFVPFTTYLVEYQGNNTFTTLDQSVAQNMFPGLTGANVAYIKRPVTFNGQLIYMAVKDGVNFQWTSSDGLFKASTLTDASRITLPGNAKPWDILVANAGSGQKVYVLGAIGSGNSYTITVHSSSDLVNWTPELQFPYTTFARSFEFLNGNFYFGMGSEVSPLPNSVGDILSVPFSLAATPSPTPTFVLGDINQSGRVDIFDFNLLLTDFNKTDTVSLRSDLNSNGRVDIFDFNILLTNFGKTSP